jgi:hypothetical protein
LQLRNIFHFSVEFCWALVQWQAPAANIQLVLRIEDSKNSPVSARWRFVPLAYPYFKNNVRRSCHTSDTVFVTYKRPLHSLVLEIRLLVFSSCYCWFNILEKFTLSRTTVYELYILTGLVDFNQIVDVQVKRGLVFKFNFLKRFSIKMTRV